MRKIQALSAYAPPSSLCMSGCGPETIDVTQSNRSHHLPKAATTKQKSKVKKHHHCIILTR